jgi:hypothetical protein
MSHNQLLSAFFRTLSDIRSAVVIAAARRYVTGKDVENELPPSSPRPPTAQLLRRIVLL